VSDVSECTAHRDAEKKTETPIRQKSHNFTSIADVHAGSDRTLRTPRKKLQLESCRSLVRPPLAAARDGCKGKKGFGTLRSLG
jgi:hypothetical protein